MILIKLRNLSYHAIKSNHIFHPMNLNLLVHKALYDSSSIHSHTPSILTIHPNLSSFSPIKLYSTSTTNRVTWDIRLICPNPLTFLTHSPTCITRCSRLTNIYHLQSTLSRQYHHILTIQNHTTPYIYSTPCYIILSYIILSYIILSYTISSYHAQYTILTLLCHQQRNKYKPPRAYSHHPTFVIRA